MFNLNAEALNLSLIGMLLTSDTFSIHIVLNSFKVLKNTKETNVSHDIKHVAR